MGKTIKQRIGTGIVLVVGGLGSLINGGCEMTPAQNMAVSGASAQHMASTNPNLSYQQRQSLSATGGLLGVLSQQEAMKEAATQGRSEVNVYVPQQQDASYSTASSSVSRTPSEIFSQWLKYLELKEAFFCEYYVEGESWKTAFKGIKNVFRDDEKIRAVSLWGDSYGVLNGKRVTLDVLAIDTNKIAYETGKLKIDPDNIIRGGVKEDALWSTHYDLSARDLKQTLGGNRFRVIWNLDNNPKKSVDLTIVDSQKKELRVEDYGSNQK